MDGPKLVTIEWTEFKEQKPRSPEGDPSAPQCLLLRKKVGEEFFFDLAFWIVYRWSLCSPTSTGFEMTQWDAWAPLFGNVAAYPIFDGRSVTFEDADVSIEKTPLMYVVRHTPRAYATKVAPSVGWSYYHGGRETDRELAQQAAMAKFQELCSGAKPCLIRKVEETETDTSDSPPLLF
jgi:hypothetical protein